jgi:predicted nucleic acid-binding protein
MNRFVLDASVGLAWFLDRPVPRLAALAWRALDRNARAIVPQLWLLEMANGFVTAERRGALSRSHIDRCFSDLEIVLATSVDFADGPISIRQAFSAASAFRLTAYDAAYVELARREQLPLATFDRELIHAATKAGVPLFSEVS